MTPARLLRHLTDRITRTAAAIRDAVCDALDVEGDCDE